MIVRRARLARILPDALGLAWVVVAGIAVLVPALAHGAALGPIDQLTRYGLTSRPGASVHYTGPGDQIEMMIPWTMLSWTQVHQGHLPLWNPYGALGTPLVFNWQSGAFGVPALVGYLLPLRLAFTAAQVVTLVVAGTGAYVFARVLRVGVLGAALAGTAFELSGPLMGWLGWPNASAMSWAGWLFAATVLIVRGRHRARSVAVFAVVLACSIYAGQPETVVLFGAALVVFLAVFLAARWRYGAGGARPAAVLRPLGDVVLAAVAGAALAAPLALPGLQLASGSVVRVASSYGALPAHDLPHLLFQGFDGIPVAGNHWFGNSIYPETATYLGVVAVALAVVALGTRRRRPAVPALAVTALAMAALSYVGPVVSIVNQATGLRSVAWHRAVQPMDFALAVLAGVGLDALVTSTPATRRTVLRWTAWAFAGVGLMLLLLWVAGRGSLPPAEASIRARSFVWPAVDTAVGLAVVAALLVPGGRRARHGATGTPGGRDRSPWRHRGRWAGGFLLLAETVFLVSAGAPLVSSSSRFPPPNAAVAALQRTVGPALVAFASRDCHDPPTLGIHQDANVVYGVRELADWDPMIPEATFRSLRRATGQPASSLGAPLILCPAVTNATVARRYGVGFILSHPSNPRPRGTVAAGRIGGELLWRVPGAAEAVLSPLGPGGSFPPTDAAGVPVGVSHPEPRRWKLGFLTTVPAVLRFHLSDVPGWSATVDGRPLVLSSFDGTMLQARVGPGRHVVVLSYWPRTFTEGIVLAVVAVVALAGAMCVSAWSRRRRRPVAGGPAPSASEEPAQQMPGRGGAPPGPGHGRGDPGGDLGPATG